MPFGAFVGADDAPLNDAGQAKQKRPLQSGLFIFEPGS